MSAEQAMPNRELCCLADLEDMPKDLKAEFVSCICRSEKFFHVRYRLFDDEPGEDDGKTLCDRRRTKDLEGFWEHPMPPNQGHCADCYGEVVAFLKNFHTEVFIELLNKKVAQGFRA